MVSALPPSRTAITRGAAEWHARQREQPLDAAAQRAFMAWLVTSPEHLREYLAVSRVAGELGDALRGMPIDLDALLAADPAPACTSNVVALPLRRASPPAAALRVRRHRAPLPRIAAAAAVLVGIGIATHLAWPQQLYYTAAHGAPRSITLPDQSIVHLNAESDVAVRFSVFQRRIELLRGQASFVVAPERRRFTVHAAGLEVQDIGTTFDVALLREQARIGVAEGSVRVLGDAGQGRLLAELAAGQSARIDYRDHAVRIGRESADTMTAWWHRRVVFQDAPLREVADQFNRLNALRLQIDDDAAGALRLTGNLRGDDIHSLRVFLDQQPALATTREANRIRVRSRPMPAADTAPQ